MAAIEINGQCRGFLIGSIGLFLQSINEIKVGISNFQESIKVLHDKSLSDAEKLSRLKILTSSKEEMINKFESSIENLSINLNLQSKQIFEALQRFEFLLKNKEKIETIDELKENSFSHTRQIKSLLEKFKTLESEKDHCDQAMILLEIQELQK